MKYLSLFSGIGGFELGIKQAYELVEKATNQKTRLSQQESKSRGRFWELPTCIGYSEIDKYAIQVYNKHFNHKGYGDITKIDTGELPDFDFLVGGFPCQSFSVAGKRGGFNDTRGTLFFEIARILRDKKPKHFLLENVKGLLSHDKGRTFQTIIGVLSDLGYRVEWQVLNSKHFGVPQNRERVFIIGHLRGECGGKVFPIGESNEVTYTADRGDYKESESASTITATYHKGGKGSHIREPMILRGRPKMPHKKGERELEYKDTCPTLTENCASGDQKNLVAMRWQRTQKGKDARSKSQKEGKDYTPFSDGHRELVPAEDKPVGALTAQAIAKDSLVGVRIKEATKQGYAVAHEGDSINMSVPNSETRRGRVGSGIAQTIDTGMQQGTLEGMRIRRLTPTECERLQGFPDGWTEGVSDTQRYKTLGNAVTTNVISAIMGGFECMLQ